MKRTKIMALLLAFCLAVPSPMATLAADTSTTPTIEGTTGDSQNPENGGASQNKENGETKDADQDGKQNENSKNADGKSAEGNSGNSNSVNGDSQNDKNGSGDSESKDSENKNSANGNSGENSNSQTGENLAKSGNSESNSVKIGETSYNSISEAISAASNGAIIIAIGSFTENITIPKEKSITLNLGGTLEASDSNSAAITNNGTLTIQGCEINGAQGSAIENHGTLQLNGTSVSCTNTTYATIINATDSSSTDPALTINGGQVTGGNYAIQNNAGTVTINDGTVITGAWGTTAILNFDKLYINGGSFTNTKTSDTSVIIKRGDSENPSVEIRGGTFSKRIKSENWIADGFEQKEITTDGVTVYQIVEKPVVAYIGDTYYTSIQEAEYDAQFGDTITLKNGQDAITLDSTIYVGKKITLDLNGVTVQSADVLGETSSQSPSDGSLFHVTANGSLTIKDSTAAEKPKVENNTEVSYNSGKLRSTNTARRGSGDQVACISVSNGGAFILESGQLESNSYGVYKYTNEQTGGTININGGYINAADTAVYVTRCADVKVTDGVLKSQDSVIVGGENSNFEISGGYLITAAGDASTCYGIVKEGKGNIRFTGGSIYVKNGYGIVMEDGVLTMTGGTIRTEGTVNSNVAGMDQCYGILLVDGRKYVDENNYNKFGSNVGDNETNTFYAEISGGKIVAPKDVDAIKTNIDVSGGRTLSEKTIGGIVVKKASSGFAPAFSKEIESAYCYSGTATGDEKAIQYWPTDNRTGQEGVDDDAPYSVDNRITLTFKYDQGSAQLDGAPGNKVTDKQKTHLEEFVNEVRPETENKVNIFVGFYDEKTNEKANLTVFPAEDKSFLAIFREVDKGTATGEAELQGTALPKDTTTAGKTVLETMSKAVKSAAEKLAKAVEKAEADTVLVSITVDANKKTRDEVSADADKIQETLASNETIQGYYDVSLTQTTYKASYTDASADVTVAAENGAGTELKPTQTTVSAALYELDTKIPVTLDMDPEYLQNRQLRVVEVHDGNVLDLEYTFDSANNLMTVQMDKFSTVAVVSATYTTVTFDSMGGSDVGKENVSYGNKVTKPADPTRSGYKFLGWYTEKAYKNAYGFDVSVTDMTPFTLYAKWEAVSTDNQDKDKDKNNSNSNSGSKSNSGSSSGSKSSSSSSSVSSANTGDQAAPALWLFVLVLAGAGAAGTGYYFRKKRQ